MKDRVLIVGGAGFIGCNLAANLASQGHPVRIYDDLSRTGVDRNLLWLRQHHGDRIDVRIADVRDASALREAVADVDAVFHLAAQVAVTTSLVSPRDDFDVNALGTLELLEAMRHRSRPPVLVYTSTNKVYGCLSDVELERAGERWVPSNQQLRMHGVDERRPLQFRTPYGCSKGCADQYVLEYAQSFGIPATVFRMSCIYGLHQLGTEDQGWVAHFVIRALAGEPITIYGDGYQVRDVLFADDLVDAFCRAWGRIDALRGRAFNIGGGPASTLSLRELLALIEELDGRRPELRHADWREGDQRYYVSDTSAFTSATGWRPRVSPRDGLTAMLIWYAGVRRDQGALHA